MDHVDHAAARVSLATIIGMMGGSALATLRGYPLRATTFRTAFSCTLVATTMFGMERLGYVAFQDQIWDNPRRLLLTSHAFSGIFGGGLNGYLFQQRPLRGMVFFFPLMMGIGLVEVAWDQQKKLRQAEALRDKDYNDI